MIYFDGHTRRVNVETIIQKSMYRLQNTGYLYQWMDRNGNEKKNGVQWYVIFYILNNKIIKY